MIIDTKNKKGDGILRTHIMEGETNSCELSSTAHTHRGMKAQHTCAHGRAIDGERKGGEGRKEREGREGSRKEVGEEGKKWKKGRGKTGRVGKIRGREGGSRRKGGQRKTRR